MSDRRVNSPLLYLAELPRRSYWEPLYAHFAEYVETVSGIKFFAEF